MQFEADYTIQLKDGTQVPLLFNFWAFRTYGQKHGIEYEDLAQGCFAKEDGTPGPTLRKNKLPGILLVGAECYCKYNNIPFAHNPELDPDLWMNQLNWDQMREIGNVFTANICRVNLNDLVVEVQQQEDTVTAEGEKKS